MVATRRARASPASRVPEFSATSSAPARSTSGASAPGSWMQQTMHSKRSGSSIRTRWVMCRSAPPTLRLGCTNITRMRSSFAHDPARG